MLEALHIARAAFDRFRYPSMGDSGLMHDYIGLGFYIAASGALLNITDYAARASKSLGK